MSYLVVIPAYNEAESVGGVIDGIKGDIPFADILVVNDGSTDQTSAVAEAKDVRIVNHPFNLGYGAALQTGFRFATRRGYDFVATMDADGQHLPSSVQVLIATMREHDADVVIGSRFLRGKFKVGIAKRIGIWLFSLIGRMHTGTTITDPTSGLQLLRRNVFSHLAQGDNYPLDYPDVNIIMALHKMKFKVVEAPAPMVEKRSGKSMHSGLRPVLYVIKMFLAVIMVWVRGKGK